MALRTATDRELLKIRIFQGVMLLAASLLIATLWRLQVRQGERFESDATRQSIRRVRLPGTRGLVFDRYGAPLIENVPKYNIVIYLEELRRPGPWSNTIDHVMGVVDEVSQLIGVAPQVDRDDVWNHIRRRLPIPLHAWTNIGEEGMARWAEQTRQIPGIDIYPQPMRYYTNGPSAAHILGYVGRADFVQEESERFDYYLPEYEGKDGIERSFDRYLRGEAGGYLVRVDVTGYRHADEFLAQQMRQARDGRDLHLALDIDIQKVAEYVLGNRTGSIVVVDPRNGDVLAMANSPRFDPNSFVPRIPADVWRRLRTDERNPLFNRATMGGYAPGSTFKPVVAMAGLENNLIPLSQRYDCAGVHNVGNARFHCWHRAGHGMIDVTESIQVSCNVYYYKLAVHSGHEYIYHMADAMGFGRRTGIDLSERAGLLPSDAWKRRTFNDAWRVGDTCNLSIGQGALMTSPLRMALVAAAFANGGSIMRPRLVLGIGDPDTDDFERIPPEIINDMRWDPANIGTIREAMRQAVMTDRGTGRRARVPGVQMAGKTGTAEFGPRGDRIKNTWMIAFAPFDNPRYAVAAIIEDGDTGGRTTAPIVGELFEFIFRELHPEGGHG